MAKEEIIRDNVTFYLYRKKDNKLQLKETKIYSPYNIKSKGFETDKFDFHNPDYVTFKKGIYVLSLAELGDEVKYDQFYEFLSFYNSKGGILSKGLKGDGTSIKNGKNFRAGKTLYYVSVDKKEEVKEKVKEVTKEVVVNSIPKIVAEGMTFLQLRSLAEQWGIEIPLDIEENANSAEIVNRYLKILEHNLT